MDETWAKGVELPLARARVGHRLALPQPGSLAFRRLSVVSMLAAVGFAILESLFGGQVDIKVYLMGGAHVASPNLYSLQLGSTGLLFTYPPFSALLFVPLAHLPSYLARSVWAAVSVSALFWLLRSSIEAVRPDISKEAASAYAALLMTPAILLDPLLVTFDFGQVNVVIVAFVMADLGLSHERIPKGILTGLAAAIKLTPLIFVPYLLLTRQVRTAVWVISTFAVCGGVGFLVSPHSSFVFWTKDVFQTSRVGGLLSISDQNLKSAAMRFAHGPVPGAILIPLTVVILIGGLVLALWAYRSTSAVLGLTVCATTGLIISPVTWAHHLVWVVPILIWLAIAPERPVHGWAWALGTAVVFWARPIWLVPRADRGLHERPWELFVGDAYLWVMLAFLVGVTWLLVTRRQRGALGV